MSDKIFLVEPSTLYKNQFLTTVSRYEDIGDTEYFDMYKESFDGFEEYVNNLFKYAKGINIDEDWVPFDTYWLINSANEILGVIRIRTSIDNEYVKKYAGHIGYDISPLQRRKGYGKEILRLGLDKAKALGLREVLLTCKQDNIGSMKIIESNGGIFESEIFKETANVYMRRYWINLYANLR